MRVLAIESTCDETGVAIVESFRDGVRVIKNLVASSAEIHQKYGGVVPEVAAREQIKSIIPLLQESGVSRENVDAVAVSYGPGLMGSLLIGVETAKALAWVWNKPLLKVNHLVGHVMANWITDEQINGLADGRLVEVPELPAVGLVVSGGHTDLILMSDLTNWKWIGGTRDDAVGEAFDKAARILGLPYPGGPEIDKAAKQVSDEEWKNMDKKYELPRSMINEDNLEMSFSGVKASLSRLTGQQVNRLTNSWVSLVAKEFTEAVCEVLEKKTLKAIEKYRPKSVIMAGGVAANSRLREGLKQAISTAGPSFFVPGLKYCGDNAAMIGAAAILRPVESELDLKPEPGLEVV